MVTMRIPKKFKYKAKPELNILSITQCIQTLLSFDCVLFKVRSKKSRVRVRATPELSFAVILLRGGGKVFLAALAPGSICTAFEARWPTVSAALYCNSSSVERARASRNRAWMPPSSAMAYRTQN